MPKLNELKEFTCNLKRIEGIRRMAKTINAFECEPVGFVWADFRIRRANWFGFSKKAGFCNLKGKCYLGDV